VTLLIKWYNLLFPNSPSNTMTLGTISGRGADESYSQILPTMIECFKCKGFFHFGCCNLAQAEYKRLTKPRCKETWKCPPCKDPIGYYAIRPDATARANTNSASALLYYKDALHIQHSASTAYSPSCVECRTTRTAPTRYKTQPDIETVFHIDIGGDMKLLQTLIGKQNNGSHFCPKCNVSKRQMARGRPHVGWCTLTEEQERVFKSHAEQHEEECSKEHTFMALANEGRGALRTGSNRV
jgi:hypothetical protein